MIYSRLGGTLVIRRPKRKGINDKVYLTYKSDVLIHSVTTKLLPNIPECATYLLSPWYTLVLNASGHWLFITPLRVVRNLEYLCFWVTSFLDFASSRLYFFILNLWHASSCRLIPWILVHLFPDFPQCLSLHKDA